jgi:antigen 43
MNDKLHHEKPHCPPCFLAGSHIRTPSGEVAVESLQPGDLVITLQNGAEMARPVVWVGHRSVKPGDITGDDAHPVRITAGAFAENIPARDLLVTAEHCIFAGGGLIPARMLVNGSSIISDADISTFTYYHVELKSHGILLAEGLATESYLDTGNRGNFANAEVVALRPSLAINLAENAWDNAAAPLLVDRASVEPVWQALVERAASRGILAGKAPRLSNDPGLHLAAPDGTVIRPMQMRNGKAVFMVPPGVGALSLVSNTARPCDTLAPFIDDRRALGVLVGEISLHTGRRKDAVNAHLVADELPGWFAPEAAGQRWTDGNASLPVTFDGLTRPAILEIEILGAGPYLAEPGQAAA